MSKKIKFIAITLVIIFCGLVYWQFSRNGQPEYETEEVTRSNVEEIVSINGTVEADSKMELRFKRSGTVKDVLVKVGQEVKAGDLLISLDDRIPQEDVNKAHAALLATEAELNLLIGGPSQEEIKISEEQIRETETILSNLEQKLIDTREDNQNKEALARLEVQRATIAMQNASINYNDVIESQNKNQENALNNLENTYKTIESNILNSFDDIRNSLTSADKILGIDDKYANDNFESLISAKNSNLWNQAKPQYENVRNNLSKQTDLYNSIRISWANDNVLTLAQNTANLLDGTKDLLDTVYEMLSESITGSNLSSTDISTYKNDISSKLSLIINDMTAINQAQQNINSTRLAYETTQITAREAQNRAQSTLDETTNALEIAQSNLQNTIAQNKLLEREISREIDLRKVNLQQVQANHQKLIAPPRNIDKAGSEARISQARSAYKQALNGLEDYQIVAPVNGFITDVGADIGENITMQESITENAIVMMNDELQIKANIPETDVAKVTISDKVEITFDALPSNNVFLGEVASIMPAEKIVQGVVYYETTITFDAQNKPIRSGMTANLDIMTAEKSDILTISPQALFYEGNEVYVFVLDNNIKTKQQIKTGIEGNDKIEILEGLQEGDPVILYEK